MSPAYLRSLAAAATCGAALAGCASLGHKPAPTAEPPPAVPPAAVAAAPPAEPVIVKVPVPVKTACVPRNLPRAPKYPDSDAALREAGGAADRYQLMAAGRLLRIQRLNELEKVVEGCR